LVFLAMMLERLEPLKLVPPPAVKRAAGAPVPLAVLPRLELGRKERERTSRVGKDGSRQRERSQERDEGMVDRAGRPRPDPRRGPGPPHPVACSDTPEVESKGEIFEFFGWTPYLEGGMGPCGVWKLADEGFTRVSSIMVVSVVPRSRDVPLRPRPGLSRELGGGPSPRFDFIRFEHWKIRMDLAKRRIRFQNKRGNGSRKEEGERRQGRKQKRKSFF